MNYKRIYDDIINNALKRNWNKESINFYTEKHHIVPKCIGGTDDINNLVELTAKEHYVCHHLLYHIYKGKNNKLTHAWWMMHVKGDTKRKIKNNSRSYEIARKANAIALKGRVVKKESIEKFKKTMSLKCGEKEICPYCGKSVISHLKNKNKTHFEFCRSNPNNKDILWVKYGIKSETKTGIALKMLINGETDIQKISQKLGISPTTISIAQSKYNKLNDTKIKSCGSKPSKFKGYDKKYNVKIGSKLYLALKEILGGNRIISDIKLKTNLSSSKQIYKARDIVERIDNVKINLSYNELDEFGFPKNSKNSLTCELLKRGVDDWETFYSKGLSKLTVDKVRKIYSEVRGKFTTRNWKNKHLIKNKLKS